MTTYLIAVLIVAALAGLAVWRYLIVRCSECGRFCHGGNWEASGVIECDECFSSHFNCAIGEDDVDAMLPPKCGEVRE